MTERGLLEITKDVPFGSITQEISKVLDSVSGTRTKAK